MKSILKLSTASIITLIAINTASASSKQLPEELKGDDYKGLHMVMRLPAEQPQPALAQHSIDAAEANTPATVKIEFDLDQQKITKLQDALASFSLKLNPPSSL